MASGPRQPAGNSCHPGPDNYQEGELAMVYGEPETARFLAAVQRLKRQRRRTERETRLAKQRVRAALRKMRDC